MHTKIFAAHFHPNLIRIRYHQDGGRPVGEVEIPRYGKGEEKLLKYLNKFPFNVRIQCGFTTLFFGMFRNGDTLEMSSLAYDEKGELVNKQ